MRSPSVVIGAITLFDERRSPYYVEGCGLAAGELEGHAQRRALPLGGLADGRGRRGLGPLADLLLHDGAARSELRDDGEEAALDGGGGPAVGSVVAEPDGVGDIRVEVG